MSSLLILAILPGLLASYFNKLLSCIVNGMTFNFYFQLAAAQISLIISVET